ncbi:branched-chain amino acid ABC transporter permease [Aneurinibacillus sp. REN35]|uniref:branched-chain amino acid ABC transporter permease n=1 Tax=Aneurinibacillus sp. REN35 TaxID=3237286 RepID=UPI003528691E
MDGNLFVQSIIDGLLMGGIYGLIGIGLTLIFGVMKIINFAQGAFLMLGMYVSYWCFALLGLNPYLSLPLSALTLFLLGMAVQRGVMEKAMDAPEHNQLLITFGLMLVIENVAMVAFSPDFRSVKVPWLESSLMLGDIIINKPRLIAFAFTIALTVCLYWFLHKTYFGKAIRASAISKHGASLVGIKVKTVNYVTFGLGAALAAIAGSLITPFFYTSPHAGSVFVLKAFVVVVLGGLGNFGGALAAGLIIGVAEALGGVLFTGDWKELVAYVLFIFILLFRPTGLFGGAAR